jgi:phosphopantetheine adenylyltransferase
MHGVITIITCLSARGEEFCSVATFSDMEHDVVANLISQITKPINDSSTTVIRDMRDGVDFKYNLQFVETMGCIS